jgi:hypothetical protein
MIMGNKPLISEVVLSHPAGFPGLISGACAGPSSPVGVPDAGVEASSSSRMDGWMRSYTKTLGGGYSHLDLSQARASATLLPRWRI